MSHKCPLFSQDRGIHVILGMFSLDSTARKMFCEVSLNSLCKHLTGSYTWLLLFPHLLLMPSFLNSHSVPGRKKARKSTTCSSDFNLVKFAWYVADRCRHKSVYQDQSDKSLQGNWFGIISWIDNVNWPSFKADVSSVSPSSQQKTKRHLWNSLRWPIYVIDSVDITKLHCYTLPPTQHHSFFRNLHLLFIDQSSRQL